MILNPVPQPMRLRVLDSDVDYVEPSGMPDGVRGFFLRPAGRDVTSWPMRGKTPEAQRQS